MIRASAWLAGIAGIAALWICGNVGAAEARAWLDRTSMHVGETVTLNVEISGDNSASQPDFSPLQGDFDLLGTQSSSSMNIINGQASSKLLWAVGLQPKRAGALTIPAFSVGAAHTEALKLTVLPPAAGAVGKAGDDLFVEAEATPRSPYVQQEVRLTVKLYYALSLIDGNLDDPKGEGLVVRKLGQDSNYTADVDGRRYRVVERHYAIAAEKSGALEMPPIVFRGRGLEPNDINSFFSRGRSVSAQAEPITLDVRARPAASGSDLWLPAQSLTLTVEGADTGKTVRVGEPLTLTVRLKAQGLGFEQLPELKLPPIDGAHVYPDKEATQNRDDGHWIYGSRERKFAVVPEHAGTLSLPQISIAWWDTEHDRAAVSDVPAQTITVAPAQPASAPQPASPTGAEQPAQVPRANAPPVAAIATGSDVELRQWRLLTYAAFGLWLVTLATGLAWLLFRRRARSRVSPPVAPAPVRVGYEFRSACGRGDLKTAARALLRRARLDRPALRNLGELARAVTDERQRAALAELERALYGAAAVAGLGERLEAAFRDGPTFASTPHATQSSALPPLYPFEIRRSGT
jgi:BatD DUF11 like domain